MMKQPSRPGAIWGMLSWFRRKLKVNEIQRAGTRAGDSTHIRVGNPWHAVGIAGGTPCCRASVAQRNLRYLSHEAPQLPLAGCSQPKKCLCKYKHYSDRRRGPRREAERFEKVLSQRVVARRVEERRVSRGRRATDNR
jgi:hypothetical protein